MKIFRENIWLNRSEQHLPTQVKWSYWNDCFTIPEGVVCFNTLSGSLVLMTELEYAKLSPSNIYDERLYSLGLYEDVNVDEYAEWIEAYKQGKCDNSFIDLTILTTRQCQFNCVYCFEGEKPKQNLTEVVAEQIKTFLINRKGTFKVLRVNWFGGEPLLGYNRIVELSSFFINFCKDNSIEYTGITTTNGYALTREKCKTLVNDCMVKRFTITIDGTRSIHNQRRPLKNGQGTYDRIWQNIHWLIEKGAQIILRITIDKNNVENISQLIDEIANRKLAKKLKIVFVRTIEILFSPDSISSVVYTPEEFAPVEIRLIDYAHRLGLVDYHLPSRSPLGGCLRSGDITVGTEGEVYKCLDTIGDDKWISGTIDAIDQSPRPQWYQNYLSWTPDDNDDCRKCKLQPLCNGGCPHNAMFADKKHGSDILCPDWRPNYRNQIIRYIKERLGADIN